MWVKDMHDRATADELAKSVPDAERLLELHQERKVSRLHRTAIINLSKAV